MHSSEDNNTLFTAWSEAERLAREAERQLYEAILAQGGQPASRTEIEHVRALRERAGELMAELLEGLRDEASLLRGTRDACATATESP